MDLITSTIPRVLSAPANALDAVLRPMDTIFNIPLVSVLLLPSLSSWSTSFNVLFFYATWSLLLLSHPPLTVEFLGTLLVRLVFFVVPSGLFLLLDTCVPFVMRSIKQHGDTGIATSAANGGLDPRTGRWWRVIALALLNLLLGVALQTAVDWVLTSVLRTRSALIVSTALPLPWAVIKNLAAAWALREVVSYVGHRYLLHCDASHTSTASRSSSENHSSSSPGSSPSSSPASPLRRLRRQYQRQQDRLLTNKASSSSSSSSSPHMSTPTVASKFASMLTSQHRRTYHSLRAPLPFSAHYDHPLAYLIRIWLPDYLPAALLRMHLLTYHLWLALVSIEEALVHSNYAALPTGLLLGGMARRAERHLAAAGGTSGRNRSGNYGAYGVLDLLMGTSLADDDESPAGFGDDVLEDAMEEAQRRGLPQRAKRKGRELVREKMGVGRRGAGRRGSGDGDDDADGDYRDDQEKENGVADDDDDGAEEAAPTVAKKVTRQRRSARQATGRSRS